MSASLLRLRPAPPRGVGDALVVGFRRACVRGIVLVLAALALGISWHAVPRTFHAEVVETCPCASPVVSD